MKKIGLFLTLVLYLLTLFLPFSRTISMKTYRQVSLSGWTIVSYHWVTFLILVLLLVLWIRFESQKIKPLLASLISIVLLYFYSLPFQSLQFNDFSVLRNQLPVVLRLALQIGYYLSALIVMILMTVLFIFPSFFIKKIEKKRTNL